MADSTRPTWTSGVLTVSSLGTTTLTLTWSGASDDTAVSTYKVYRGSSEIAEVSSPTVTYDVTALRAGKRYDFSVEAVDAAGNKSIDGPTASATTRVADYGKIQITGVYSKNADYSDPKVVFEPDNYSVGPTEFIKMTVEGEASVGTDIDTSIMSSISLLIVRNPHATQTLQLVIGNIAHDSPGDGDGFTTNIAPGGLFATTDALAAGKVNVGPLSGEAPIAGIEVFVVGS